MRSCTVFAKEGSTREGSNGLSPAVSASFASSVVPELPQVVLLGNVTFASPPVCPY
jgi:hypothetical protein